MSDLAEVLFIILGVHQELMLLWWRKAMRRKQQQEKKQNPKHFAELFFNFKHVELQQHLNIPRLCERSCRGEVRTGAELLGINSELDVSACTRSDGPLSPWGVQELRRGALESLEFSCHLLLMCRYSSLSSCRRSIGSLLSALAPLALLNSFSFSVP